MTQTLSRTLRAAAALLAFSLPGAALPAYAGQVVTKPEFTVTLPDGWVEVPPAVMAAAKAKAARSRPNAPQVRPLHFNYAFQPPGAPHWLKSYPRLVVYITPGDRIPEGALKRMQKLDTHNIPGKNKDGITSALFNQLKLNKPLYDASSHTVWMTTHAIGIHGEPLRELGCVFLTKGGYIQLSAYIPKAQFASSFTLMHAVMTSVVLAPAMRY